jgi:biofilm PGA synthesis N-glycosyltransferase PgaC
MNGSLPLALFLAFGALLAFIGAVSLIYYPLIFRYVRWERIAMQRAAELNYAPTVAVLVPAFNEATTLAASLQSILASDYADFEIIVINDGSTDATAQVLDQFSAHPNLRVLTKANGGKASALNLGLASARGEIVLFTDADTVFQRDTIARAIAYLADPAVGAAGGDDTPLHPRGWLQRMLVVTSHIGTGFVRRALSAAGVLPIIPGNLGIVRAALLRDAGGFREIWGEDLELTFRLQRRGVRIVYAAGARVAAECPGTLRDLWQQRVRWVRSYIKVLNLHRDLLFDRSVGRFAFYLPFNAACFALLPLLQCALLLLLPMALLNGAAPVNWFEWAAYFGLASLLAAAITATLLDRAPRDLIHLPWLVFLIPMSLFYNAVVVWSLWSEWRARRENWGVLTRRDPAHAAQLPQRIDRRWALTGGAAAAVVGLSAYRQRAEDSILTAAPAVAAATSQLKLAVAIHFADWDEPRDALRSLLAAPQSQLMDRIAVSAGRVDWTYFDSSRLERWLSREATARGGTLFHETLDTLHRRGHRTTAVLDVFAPRYLAAHPSDAAIDTQGRASRDIVCATVLAKDRYGEMLRGAVEALCARVESDSISITELFYDVPARNWNERLAAPAGRRYRSIRRRSFDLAIRPDRSGSVSTWRDHGAAWQEVPVRREAQSGRAGAKQS